MNRVNIGDFCGTDDAVNAKIAFGAGAPADTNGFVRHLHMHGIVVGLGVDRHRFDVQFLGGSNDANSNLPAVGNQNFLKHI
jgi:hypothetical protein